MYTAPFFKVVHVAALALAFFVSFFAKPFELFAQGLENPINQASLYCFLTSILQMLVLILFPIVILFSVYSGYLFVAAQGNPAKITEAKKYSKWVFAGALIMLGSQALAFAVESTVENIYVDSGLGNSLVTGRSACP